MFTQPCFIRKNTPELREKLEELGYKNVDVFKNSSNIICASGYWQSYPDENLLLETDLIDCGTNEQLFLALAALRDDSDYMQWFTEYYGGMVLWSKCEEDKQSNPYRRKATPSELIEHFKNK